MKNTFRTIISLTVIAAFVILNWATSQEIDYRELNAEATIYQDTLIVFNNLDDLNVVAGDLVLYAPEANEFKEYRIAEYALSSLSTDTLEMIEFVDENNIAYTDSIRPSSLSLTFFTNGNTGESAINFSTDL